MRVFYGWIIVAVGFVTMAVGVNARTAFSLLFPPILDEFGWERGVTAGAFSFGFLVSAALSPLVGRLMDRRGPRVVIEMGVIVMAAGTSSITERSPYIVRTSFTLAQTTVIIADWAAKNGVKRVVTMVNDFAPGLEAESSFKERFGQAGGQVVEAIRFPLAHPDFAPFLQRARDASPDAIFAFVVSGQGGCGENALTEIRLVENLGLLAASFNHGEFAGQGGDVDSPVCGDG